MFKVVYIYSILVVLTIGFLALRAISHSINKQNEQARLSKTTGIDRQVSRAKVAEIIGRNSGSRKSKSKPELDSLKPVLKRELKRVPTPWGWERHQERNGEKEGSKDLSDVVRSFAGRLTRKKEPLQSNSNPHKPKSNNSVRALLEDRYGPVSQKPAQNIEYQKVKAPRLRDPGRPHDQLDSFDSREAERIHKKVQLVKAMNAELGFVVTHDDFRYVSIKDIKQPWGW